MENKNLKFLFTEYTGDRDTRAKAAKSIINNAIPTILRSNPRARKGIEAVERIVDPPPVPLPDVATSDRGRITIVVGDVIQMAAILHANGMKLPPRRRPRIAILNMASPLRPGGGVLTGAGSQEESICRRTTLYPSLREEFYRLPEIGGVYTPAVLVFRLDDGNDPAKLDDKKEWFFVDVVTAAMLRLPDVEGEGDAARYARDADREAATRKMTAVMRMLKAKGVDKVVLGAWGCGAYGNPVGEIARAWRRVLLGRVDEDGVQKERGKGKGTADESECWREMEVVFAIKDKKMTVAFTRAFGSKLLEYGLPGPYDMEE
ncbi:uncharacterized protein DNG_09005 [Cephalotrichum gorgonifer]|uniref:Microbial-type PARG catalytic domain-containing protein n=1 Tax=Cephalotrichum gorgonifer TaxID=2041049 RepID=A0AAE8SYW4_9PEZI|nr:uncharacterized protein DNG_09005 [Cephalotrichum gorgonifer]